MPNTKRACLLLLSLALVSSCSSQAQNDGLSSSTSSAEVHAQGVPGGVTAEMEQITAVISDIDYKKRTFTLQDQQGHRQTFQAVPEIRNFPQMKVGDRVTATVTRERVVYLREPGESREDGATGVLATAPEGDKPGIMAADTVEVTAVVKAIDAAKHTATLEFADGSRKTVAVRPDVELKPSYVNQEVVIRLTSAVAITVEAP